MARALVTCPQRSRSGIYGGRSGLACASLFILVPVHNTIRGSHDYRANIESQSSSSYQPYKCEDVHDSVPLQNPEQQKHTPLYVGFYYYWDRDGSGAFVLGSVVWAAVHLMTCLRASRTGAFCLAKLFPMSLAMTMIASI